MEAICVGIATDGGRFAVAHAEAPFACGLVRRVVAGSIEIRVDLSVRTNISVDGLTENSSAHVGIEQGALR
jgi:hypothetical protein